MVTRLIINQFLKLFLRNYKMDYFQSRKNIYWPKKYEGVVNTLRPQIDAKASSADFKPFFKTNAHVLVFAAALGLVKGMREPLDKERNEIDRLIFEGNHFHAQRLVYYMALIVFFSIKDEKAEVIREENDDVLIREFEELAAGGLKYLQDCQFNNENHDATAQTVMQEILASAYKNAIKSKT